MYICISVKKCFRTRPAKTKLVANAAQLQHFCGPMFSRPRRPWTREGTRKTRKWIAKPRGSHRHHSATFPSVAWRPPPPQSPARRNPLRRFRRPARAQRAAYLAYLLIARRGDGLLIAACLSANAPDDEAGEATGGRVRTGAQPPRRRHARGRRGHWRGGGRRPPSGSPTTSSSTGRLAEHPKVSQELRSIWIDLLSSI